MPDKLTKEEWWVLEEKYGQKEIRERNPQFEADRARLAAGEPVAYVVGWQSFLGLRIHLDSRPLIPRPETEWWTEQLLTHLTQREPTGRSVGERVPRFLDLCAGSGAIGCAALKALPYMEVWFGEIDPAHEATIRKNIAVNDLDASRAHISIGDLFAPFGDTTFDIIACNPPYIPEGRELPESVARHEPPEALYAGADGLALIRRIAAELPARLAPGGVAWIECDAANVEDARDLLRTSGFAADIMHDQYDRPRVIVVQSL